MPNGTFDDDQAEGRAAVKRLQRAGFALAGVPSDDIDRMLVDDPDVPSPIDSDAPASVHGGRLIETREQARELFGRGSVLGEQVPLPLRLVERGKP